VAAASGDDYAFDRLAASAARLAGPLVYAKLGQEISGPAFNVNVIAEAGALKFHGVIEHALYGPQQSARLFRGKPPRLHQRIQPRKVERFIRVDIPNASQKLLIHQPAF